MIIPSRGQKDHLGTLVKILRRISYEQIPPRVRNATQIVILDTLGVILLGNRTPYLQNLSEQWTVPSSPKISTILGYDFNTFPHLAGFINGSGGTVHELDEGHRFSRGHPGIHVIPTALAIGEYLNVSGKALIRAIVLGYELTAKIAMAIQPLKPEIHPHGTWGAFGSAFTAGLLFGFNSSQLEKSLHAAGTLGLEPHRSAIDQGAQIRNLYAGLGIMNGVLSTMMVKANISVPNNGFWTYSSKIGAEKISMDTLLSDVATHYEITRNYFKMHAACAHVHSSIEAMSSLLKKRPIPPMAIKSILIKTYWEASKLNKKSSLDFLSAKFSIPYAISSLILFRDTGQSAFETSKIREVEASGLLEKITVSLDPKYKNSSPISRPSMVEVILNNGTKISANCFIPKGNFDNPYSQEEITEKFKSLTESLLDLRYQQELIRLVENLEKMQNIRELIKCCKYRHF